MPDARTHPHSEMPSIDELTRVILEKQPAHRDLYLAVHRLFCEVVPGLRYSVDLHDGVIGYGQRQYGYDGWGMAALSPHKNWVSVILFRGAQLDIPEGLFEGGGPNMRHLKLRSHEEFEERRELLAGLIAAAVGIPQREEAQDA